MSFLTLLKSRDLAGLQERMAQDPLFARTLYSQPQQHGEEMWMPLHLAVQEQWEDGVRALLAAGVKPDTRTRFASPFHARRTALHLCALSGNTGIASILLEAGAEPDLIDAYENTPLHLACLGGHISLVSTLLGHGADVLSSRGDGLNPLHLAIEGARNQTTPASWIECAKLLLEQGVAVDCEVPRDAEGFTVLHRAVTIGDLLVPLAEPLLQRCCEPPLISRQDPRFQRTPMQWALALERVAWAKVLQPYAM